MQTWLHTMVILHVRSHAFGRITELPINISLSGIILQNVVTIGAPPAPILPHMPLWKEF